MPCTYRPSGSVEASGSHNKRKHEDTQNPTHDLQILELLKSAPSDAALEILGNLRGGASATGILDTFGCRGLSSTPISSTKTAQGCSAPTYSTLEFCLNSSHTNAFPPLTPLHVEQVDLRLLSLGGRKSLSNRPPKKRRTELCQDGISQPPSVLVDARLEDMDISYWTAVKVDNAFAARAISFYLEVEHPLIGIFDPGLFLTDFFGHSTRFCSPLLVSSLLAWSCVRLPISSLLPLASTTLADEDNSHIAPGNVRSARAGEREAVYGLPRRGQSALGGAPR